MSLVIVCIGSLPFPKSVTNFQLFFPCERPRMYLPNPNIWPQTHECGNAMISQAKSRCRRTSTTMATFATYPSVPPVLLSRFCRFWLLESYAKVLCRRYPSCIYSAFAWWGKWTTVCVNATAVNSSLDRGNRHHCMYVCFWCYWPTITAWPLFPTPACVYPKTQAFRRRSCQLRTLHASPICPYPLFFSLPKSVLFL